MAEIEDNRARLRAGKVKEVLAKQVEKVKGSEEIFMALRISSPSPSAFLACAKVLQGDVPYNLENDSIYPVAVGARNNLSSSSACAIVLEILQEMKRLSSASEREMMDSSLLKICFREIF